MRRYTNYDLFARAYNQTWGGAASPYLAQALTALQHIALHQIPADGRILDLACGPGRLAYLLTKRGYRVSGVDGSSAMIHYAKENAPQADFMVADVRDFTLPGTVHAVVETGDGLNHIPTLGDLRRVFANVYACLEPDGLFAFDFLTPERFIKGRNIDLSVQGESSFFVMQQRCQPKALFATMDFTIFYQQDDDSWQRSDVLTTQHGYADEVVRSALSEAGFVNIRRWAATDLGITIAVHEVAFYTCHKPRVDMTKA